MAVLPEIPGLTVSVTVAGQIAREYNDPDSPAEVGIPTTSCYIESKSGAEFAIETRITPDFELSGNFDLVIVRVTIDGAYAHGKVLDPKETSFNTISSQYVSSKKAGYVEDRNFVFSPINKVDDGDKNRVARDFKVARDLGTLKVIIYSAKGKGFEKVLRTHDPKDDSFELAEKSMKGKELSHGTRHSTARVVRNPGYTTMEQELRLGVFYFRYRSQDALQKEFIIPRPSTPAEAETTTVDDIANLSEDEIRRLAKERLRDISSGRDNSRAVKRELSPYPVPSRPLKVVKLDDGREAFDLTEDD